MKDSFILYTSQYMAIKDLSNEQLGRLFRALFENQLKNNSKTTETNVVLEDDIKIAFNFINNQMLMDNEKYLKKCEKLRENAKKGGAPRGNQNARKQAKQPNREKNNLNDNVNDNDNDNELLISPVVDINNKNTTTSLFELVETGFGRTLNGIEYEEIKLWEDTELTRYAIKQAILNGKCTIGYIKTILSSYKRENIQTMQQALKREEDYQKNKNRNFRYQTLHEKNMEVLEKDREEERLMNEQRRN